MNLDEKLKKIEALFEGARTDGERQAAGLARQRVLDRLQVEMSDHAIEFTIRLHDRWTKRLFVSLCNKYGLRTYRFKGQKYTTTMVRVSESFMNETLWPEFKTYSASLSEFISNVTDDLISRIHDVEEDVIVSGECLPH